MMFQKNGSSSSWCRWALLLSLALLLFVLPIAHTATLRTIGMVVPLLLLLYRAAVIRDVRWIRSGFEIPFLAFFVAAAMSVPFSINVSASLGEIKGELITPIILFYVVYYVIEQEDQAEILLWVLFAGSLVFSLYSFYDVYRHGGTVFPPTYRAGGLRDPGGGEVAGLYHTMVTPFLFLGAVFTRRRSLRWIFFVILAINLFALHLTNTRAAYLATVVQVVIAAIMLAQRRRWILSLFMLLLIGGCVVFYFNYKMLRDVHHQRLPTIHEFLNNTPEEIVGNTPNNITIRLGMWKTALDKVAENPLLPHGYGRFLFGSIVRNEKNRNFILAQTHNSFVGTLFELGIQGFVVYLAMIGTFFWVCWHYWCAATDYMTTWLSGSLLIMMAGYWVNNFFGSFDADDSKLLFMVLLGIGMAVMHRLPKSETDRGGRS